MNPDATTILNQFCKCAEPNPLQRYARRFRQLSPEQRVRAVENILAGDEVDVAIRDAKILVDNALSIPLS